MTTRTNMGAANGTRAVRWNRTLLGELFRVDVGRWLTDGVVTIVAFGATGLLRLGVTRGAGAAGALLPPARHAPLTSRASLGHSS